MKFEGVTADVSVRMQAVGATVLTEDNYLLRRCQCGVGHPVGHLYPDGADMGELAIRSHHQRASKTAWYDVVPCCGCCQEWQ